MVPNHTYDSYGMIHSVSYCTTHVIHHNSFKIFSGDVNTPVPKLYESFSHPDQTEKFTKMNFIYLTKIWGHNWNPM